MIGLATYSSKNRVGLKIEERLLWVILDRADQFRRPFDVRTRAKAASLGRMASPFPVEDFRLLFFASFPGAPRVGPKCEELNVSKSLCPTERTSIRRAVTSLTGHKQTTARPQFSACHSRSDGGRRAIFYGE